MKKFFTLAILLLFFFSPLLRRGAGGEAWAQSPNKINYQGLARDASGNPITNTSIGVKFIIHQGATNGANVFEENHPVTTNQFGLFNVFIGGGTLVSGNFSNINWSNFLYFLEVQVDPDGAGGAGFAFMGTTQFVSVPYAMHAATADSLTGSAFSFAPWNRNGNKVHTKFLADSVGIGTVSPTGKLDVLKTSSSGKAGVFQISNTSNAAEALFAATNGSGTSVFGINIGTGSAGIFQIQNAANPQAALVATTNGTGLAGDFSGKLRTTSLQVTGGSGTAGQVLTSDASGNATWQAAPGTDNLGDHTATQNIILGTNYLSGDGGNEGITIDGTGNVGIGGAPTVKLDVNGGAIRTTDASGAFVSAYSSAANSTSYLDMVAHDAGSISKEWRIINNAPASELVFSHVGQGDRMLIDGNGKVIIKNSTPELLLESSAGAFKAGITVKTLSPKEWFLGQENGGPGHFRISDVTAGQTRIDVDGSGNVGLGTTTPVARLHVNDGHIRSSNVSNAGPTLSFPSGLAGITLDAGSTDTKGTVKTTSNIPAGSIGSFTLNFGQAYNSAPVVVVTASGVDAEFLNCAVKSSSTTDAVITVFNSSGATIVNAPSFNYIVIE